MRVHHINNINRALDVLQEYGVKLVNISSDDIVGGSPKLTLGLIWTIALSFDGQKLVNSQAISGIEKSLLAWVQQYTAPLNLKVSDFSSSWSDGSAFLAVLHENIPKFDLAAALKLHPIARLRMAFDLASRHLQIDQLLDPEDVNTHRPDKKSILMYVMCLYHAIDSKNTELGSMQHLAENFGGSTEEIQLLEERDGASQKSGDSEENDKMSVVKEEDDDDEDGEMKHVGNVTDLDEISLTKSVENISRIPVPLSRSRTFVKDEVDTALKPMETTISQQESVMIASSSQIMSESRSRPTSTATNFSVEIGGYQTAIEEVLTMLLEADEFLARDLPEVTELAEIKDQFHDHEEFMLRLSEHQQYVGGALEEGARLIAESQSHTQSGLTVDDQNEIRQQMFLLNEKWENLRCRALELQTSIHGRLAKIQNDKIEELRVFLTSTEDRISRMNEITTDTAIVDVKSQVDETRLLKNDLEEQQRLVDSLSTLVIIVDDESDNFGDLEDRLSALGERWSHVVNWTTTRWDKLHEIQTTIVKMNAFYKILCRWMDAREKDIKSMESMEVTEIGGIMKRMKDLQYCEHDMSLFMAKLDELEAIVQSLPLNDREKTTLIEEIEKFTDRSEAMKQILDIQKHRIETMGFKVPTLSNDVKHEKPENWTNFLEEIESYQRSTSYGIDMTTGMDVDGQLEFERDDTNHPPGSHKKRKLHKPEKLLQLEEKMSEITNFLGNADHHLRNLENNDDDNQLKILQQIKDDLLVKIDEYPSVQKLKNEVREENGDYDLSAEESRLSEIESSIDELNFRLDDLIAHTKDRLATDQFYNSLTALKLGLADTRDWFKQNANTSSLEELETRLSDMKMRTDEIETMKSNGEVFKKNRELRKDFDLFEESWTDLRNAITTLIHQKNGDSDHVKELKNFIEEMKNVEIVNDGLEHMNENLVKLNALKEGYSEMQETYDYVMVNERAKLKDDFKMIWEDFWKLINDKIISQVTAIENVIRFNDEHTKIRKNLDEKSTIMNDDYFVFGEMPLLRNKSKQYEDLFKELKNIEIDILSLKNFSDIITKGSGKEHEEAVNKMIGTLSDQYSGIYEQFIKNQSALDDCKQETEAILSRIRQTELWLNDLEMNTPKVENNEIRNSNELFQIKTKFQSLKESCEQMTIKFRELNDDGSKMLIQIDDLVKQRGAAAVVVIKLTYLAKQFTKLNARWNEVTSLVYTRTALLEHVSSQLGEFKTLVVSETGYLDKLETLLRKSPAKAVDAEEILEELDVSFCCCVFI